MTLLGLLLLAQVCPPVEWLDSNVVRLTSADKPKIPRPEPASRSFRVEQQGCKFRIHGTELTMDGIRFEGGVFLYPLRPGERIYGLGPRVDARLDARGTAVQTDVPRLVSSEGYALRAAGAKVSVEVGDELRIATDEIILAAGPPKAALESLAALRPARWRERRENLNGLDRLQIPPEAPFLEGSDCESILRRGLHAAMSGQTVWSARAAGPCANWFPYVVGNLKRDWMMPLWLTYLWEARTRGIPVVRPLAMQFPRDARAAAESRAWMFGDELLIAPSGEFYLPMGVWTELETDEVLKGRTVAKGPKVLARNGTIVPRQEAGFLELHYYPKLGAEFFLWEPETEQVSQYHAAPVGDLLRLESEDKAGRTLRWVVHHVPRPVSVDRAKAWRYEHGKLIVEVEALYGGDEIINIRFPVSK
ncbi:MAG: hypothetical protein MUC42_02180 [Bryobacter sp.]|nr:hypothetical protein [Bryobacter sp.]